VAERDDEIIPRLIAQLRQPVPMRRDQVDRIMAIVEADAAPSATTLVMAPRSRRRYWVWGGGLATVAATAAALLLAVPHAARAPRGLVATAAASAMAPAATVDFALNLATAKRVSVVGDFNHWDVRATPLQRPAKGGEWHAAVRLPLGRHVYAFVVDGVRWVPDPAAPRAVDDDFGSPNSVLTVVPIRGST
jgi:hypothetical protein